MKRTICYYSTIVPETVREAIQLLKKLESKIKGVTHPSNLEHNQELENQWNHLNSMLKTRLGNVPLVKNDDFLALATKFNASIENLDICVLEPAAFRTIFIPAQSMSTLSTITQSTTAIAAAQSVTDSVKLIAQSDLLKTVSSRRGFQFIMDTSSSAFKVAKRIKRELGLNARIGLQDDFLSIAFKQHRVAIIENFVSDPAELQDLISKYFGPVNNTAFMPKTRDLYLEFSNSKDCEKLLENGLAVLNPAYSGLNCKKILENKSYFAYLIGNNHSLNAEIRKSVYSNAFIAQFSCLEHLESALNLDNQSDSIVGMASIFCK